jgi:hypothetical protein
MKKTNLILLLCLLLITIKSNAQVANANPALCDKAAFGIGMGLDYGGFGGNLLVYPQKNVGVFLGAGYALVGVGYNVGTKLRLLPKRESGLSPFFLAMYGYNAAIAISNAHELDKIFYGVNIGIGFDTGIRPTKAGYWSFALLIPFRSPDVDLYIDDLKQNHGAEFKNELLPFAISIGYRFILDRYK